MIFSSALQFVMTRKLGNTKMGRHHDVRPGKHIPTETRKEIETFSRICKAPRDPLQPLIILTEHRNMLIAKMNMASHVDFSTDVILLDELFLLYLQYCKSPFKHKIPFSYQWDGYNVFWCKRRPMAFVCVYLLNPHISKQSASKILYLAYERLPQRGPGMYKQISVIMMDMIPINPDAFCSVFTSFDINMLTPEKPYRKIAKLEEITREMLRRKRKLITYGFLDAALETTHNYILNSIYISEEYSTRGFSLLYKLGVCCAKTGYLVQLSNVIRVFHDILFFEHLTGSKPLRENYCTFLIDSGYEWQKFCTNELIYLALRQNPDKMVSTRSVLDISCINFTFLVKLLLPLLQDLFGKISATNLKEYADSVLNLYICLLYPPNIKLEYFEVLVMNFQLFLGLVAKARLTISEECIKMSALYSSVGLTYCASLQSYVEQRTEFKEWFASYGVCIKDKLFPCKEVKPWKSGGVNMRAFIVPHQLLFLMVKYENNNTIFANLQSLMDSNVNAEMFKVWNFYSNLQLEWFSGHTVDILGKQLTSKIRKLNPELLSSDTKSEPHEP